MKKLLLSALTIGVMFVSCGKDDIKQKDCPKTPDNVAVSTSPIGVFSDIAFIQGKMSSNPQLAKEVYDSFKNELAVGSVLSDVEKKEVRKQLGDWILEINSSTVTATQGVAGKLGKRYVNNKGVEPEQLVKKGLIGAYQLSEALLVTSQLRGNVDKEAQQKLFDKFVTVLLGSTAYLDATKGKINNHKKIIDGYPEMAGNEFAKYLNTVSSNPAFSTLSDDFYNTLRNAKKEIGNKEKLAEKLKEVRNLAAKVVAIRCAHYLQTDKYDKVLNADGAHGVSEGIGFYYSLQFTYDTNKHGKAYVSYKEVQELLNMDLWDIATTKPKLQTLAGKLGEIFNFSAIDAKK